MLPTKRQLALHWWSNLSDAKKDNLFQAYKMLAFTPADNHPQLTGREIEKLWEIYSE